jgi:hypothetical protein
MLPFIDCAVGLNIGHSETRPVIYDTSHVAATWPTGVDWPTNSISHLLRDYAGLEFPVLPRVLTNDERQALDRALWRSVQIIDNGFE